MRDDEPTSWTALKILGTLCFVWVMLKLTVIGYYTDELFVQVIIPLAAGGALLAVDRAGSRDSG
jgi:hypothetical protein